MTDERGEMGRNPLEQLQQLGEEVLGKAQQNPAAARVLQSAMQLKDRVDDLSKRVRGLEQLEQRLGKVEQRLAKLEGTAKLEGAPKKPPAAKS